MFPLSGTRIAIIDRSAKPSSQFSVLESPRNRVGLDMDAEGTTLGCSRLSEWAFSAHLLR